MLFTKTVQRFSNQKQSKKKNPLGAARNCLGSRAGVYMVESFISIDLETTGLNPKTDKIIEIGAVKINRGKVVDTFATYINPGRKLPSCITEITGIRETDLAEAPTIKDMIASFHHFLGDEVVLGHSVMFDYSFLKRACVNEKLDFEKKALDTLKIARAYLPELESRTLSNLCGYFKIEHHAHRAFEDAMATFLLYQKLEELFYTKEEGKLFLPTDLNYQVKRESPITKAQKERLTRLLMEYHITPDFQIEMLTRNEASRKIDKILASYGGIQSKNHKTCQIQ
jgi:DNA polymerase III subunit epsilon